MQDHNFALWGKAPAASGPVDRQTDVKSLHLLENAQLHLKLYHVVRCKLIANSNEIFVCVV